MTTDADKVREGFEEWCLDETTGGWTAHDLRRHPQLGVYEDYDIASRWTVWQAASRRAAAGWQDINTLPDGAQDRVKRGEIWLAAAPPAAGEKA